MTVSPESCLLLGLLAGCYLSDTIHQRHLILRLNDDIVYLAFQLRMWSKEGKKTDGKYYMKNENTFLI